MGVKCANEEKRKNYYKKEIIRGTQNKNIQNEASQTSLIKNNKNLPGKKINQVIDDEKKFDNSDNSDNSEYEKSLLIHNKLRKAHGAEVLTLNDDLCILAQKCAEECAKGGALEHCPYLFNGDVVGENICQFGEKSLHISQICQKWSEEKFDISQKKYDSGAKHFTQIIWKNTKLVGFGLSSSPGGNNYFIAFYYPAGNIFNQFSANV